MSKKRLTEVMKTCVKNNNDLFVLDVIALIEEVLLKILKARTGAKMRQAGEKSKPSKPNISKEERLTLKLLHSDEKIIILPADKGNAAVVIMDYVEYSNKMADLISNGGYYKVKKKTRYWRWKRRRDMPPTKSKARGISKYQICLTIYVNKRETICP